jgi:hypothetical protein
MGNLAYMQRFGQILDWVRVRQWIFLLALGTVLILYSASLILWDTAVYRAKILFDSGKPAGAAQAFARARKVAPPGTEAEAWFSRELISSNRSVDQQELNLVLYNSLKASIEKVKIYLTYQGSCDILSHGRTKDPSRSDPVLF